MNLKKCKGIEWLTRPQRYQRENKLSEVVVFED